MKASLENLVRSRSTGMAKSRAVFAESGEPNYQTALAWGLLLVVAAATILASYDYWESFDVEEADSDSPSILRTPSDGPRSSESAGQHPLLLGDSEHGPVDDIGTLFRSFP